MLHQLFMVREAFLKPNPIFTNVKSQLIVNQYSDWPEKHPKITKELWWIRTILTNRVIQLQLTYMSFLVNSIGVAMEVI